MPMIARKGRAHQQSVTGRPQLSPPPTSAVGHAAIIDHVLHISGKGVN